jgi:hypothetical protein
MLASRNALACAEIACRHTKALPVDDLLSFLVSSIRDDAAGTMRHRLQQQWLPTKMMAPAVGSFRLDSGHGLRGGIGDRAHAAGYQ